MQRRTLAKGFLTAAAAAFGSHAIAKEAIPNFKWDEETEVLIAGFGGAGAAAAIEAHDAGAKVLILEKLEAGGGNTSVSAGGIMIPKDKEQAYEYLTKTFEYAGSEMDQELLRTFVDQIVQQREFLLGMAEGSRSPSATTRRLFVSSLTAVASWASRPARKASSRTTAPRRP